MINDAFMSDATVIYRCIPIALIPAVITSFEATPTALTLSFTTQTNRIYSVEASGDLESAQWAKVGNSMAGTGGTITYTETQTLGAPRRFLRVGVTLP